MKWTTLIGSALLLSAPAGAQTVGGAWTKDYIVRQDFAGQRLGPAVASIGDLNGDGRDDFAIASAAGFFNGPGQVLLQSGLDGSRLSVLGAPYQVFSFSSIAAAGDVDRDGIGDIVAGAPNSIAGGLGNVGSVIVYSGATGAVLHRLDGALNGDKLGESVAGAGDVDGDGHADVITGGPYSQGPGGINSGLACVYSGATGQLLYRFVGLLGSESVGWAVCGVGDWNADGHDDFAYSAITTAVAGVDRAGSVFVRSGADGSVLQRYDGGSVFQRLGWDLDAADVDADGLLDLVVGDPFLDLPRLEDAGSVRVYSGATGLLIRQIFGADKWASFGYSVARAGNLDGDANDDLIVGIPYAYPGHVAGAGSIQLLSGSTGALLDEEHGTGVEQHFGMYVASAGDVDADGFDHVLIGAYGSSMITVAGRQCFLTSSAESVSVAAGGRIVFDLRFPPAAASAFYQVLLSGTGSGPAGRFGLQVPLTPDPLFYRAMERSYPGAATGFFGVLGADGRAAASVFVPPGTLSSALIGRQIWFAAVARDWSGAGLFSSVARSLRFDP